MFNSRFFINFSLIGLFLIISMVLSLIWIPKGYSFMSEEDNFANYQSTVYKNSTLWNKSLNNGNPTSPSDISAIIPNGLFYFFLSSLNIKEEYIQKIFLSLILFFTFSSTYFLLKMFVKDKYLILTGILFYYFNFFTKSTIFYTSKMFQLLLMPLLFVFFYKYLKTNSKKYLYFNLITLIAFMGLFTNLPNLFVTLTVYIICGFYYFLKNYVKNYYKEFKRIISFFIPLTPIFIFQLLIYYFSFFSNNSFQLAVSQQTFSALSSNLNLLLQQRGAWWEFVSFGNISYNPWLWFYNSTLIVAISFLLLIVIFFSLIRYKFEKEDIFWCLVLLLFTLLASGSSFYPPIYTWLYTKIPLFYVFREPWAKFTPLMILSLTVLLVISLKKINNRYITFIVLILLAIRAYPFFSPDFSYVRGERFFTPFIKLPTEWQDYESWTKNNLDKNLLLIPLNYFKRNWYKENLGNANHPLAKLFGYTGVVYDIQNNSYGSLLHFFIERNNTNFIKITSLDYALLQKDVDTKEKDYTPKIKSYNLRLLDYFLVKPIIEFGNKLSLLSIKPEYKLPLIYTPKKIFIDNQIDDLIEDISDANYDITSTIFLRDQNKDKNYILDSLINNNKANPIISFKEIDPTYYNVNISNANSTFALVFNNSFNPYWKAYPTILNLGIKANILNYFFPNYVDDEKHLTANGYANSWIIDPIQICKKNIYCSKNKDSSYNIKLIVEYTPQRFFRLAKFMLIVTFVVSVFGLLISRDK